MRYLLNIVYCLLLLALSPWVVWRVVVQKKNRRGWRQKLFGSIPRRESDRPCIWVHAVSVGEVNLLGPLLAELEGNYPDIEIAISTTTETGFDLANKKFADKLVFFCPADFSWAINRVIHRLRPSMLLLTELELWPNLISVTSQQGVAVALINGRVSENSFHGYRRARFFVSRLLNKLDIATVQTEQYGDRLQQLGMQPDRIHVCGNMKFDCFNLSDDNQRMAELVKLAAIEPEQFVFLAGSTQENEDKLAIEVYQKLVAEHPQLKLILVPRHPERTGRLTTYMEEQGVPYRLRSQLPDTTANRSTRSPIENSAVLIVDVIGELRDWWQRADAGYVGGSIGTRGGQSMIEPAAFAVPICFGPDTENFKDVVELLKSNNAAQVVHNVDDISSFVRSTLTDKETATSMGDRAQQTVTTQRGATSRTHRALQPKLSTLSTPATKPSPHAEAA